jgi:hypothetical protein
VYADGPADWLAYGPDGDTLFIAPFIEPDPVARKLSTREQVRVYLSMRRTSATGTLGLPSLVVIWGRRRRGWTVRAIGRRFRISY